MMDVRDYENLLKASQTQAEARKKVTKHEDHRSKNNGQEKLKNNQKVQGKKSTKTHAKIFQPKPIDSSSKKIMSIATEQSESIIEQKQEKQEETVSTQARHVSNMNPNSEVFVPRTRPSVFHIDNETIPAFKYYMQLNSIFAPAAVTNVCETPAQIEFFDRLTK